VKSRRDVHRKLWSKNVLLGRELRKKPDKRDLSVQNEEDEERRPNLPEVDVTEMNVPESADIRLHTDNQKQEIHRRLQNQKSVDTGLKI
jgi:hypothetical protein